MSFNENFDPENEDYLDHLDNIAEEDAEGLRRAQESYGNSWKSRGGVGAFMMLARKWDRLENRIKRMLAGTGQPTHGDSVAYPYDIFAHIAADDRSEGVIDDVRDLRRYLMLVEAEMRSYGAPSATSTHRDNQ